jgi:hypothetical protein
MSPHGDASHNVAGVVSRGRFLVFIKGCGWVPGQGLMGQVEPLKGITIPFVKGWSPHIMQQSDFL